MMCEPNEVFLVFCQWFEVSTKWHHIWCYPTLEKCINSYPCALYLFEYHQFWCSMIWCLIVLLASSCSNGQRFVVWHNIRQGVVHKTSPIYNKIACALDLVCGLSICLGCSLVCGLLCHERLNLHPCYFYHHTLLFVCSFILLAVLEDHDG
jgi:hypothetical protein